MIHNANAKTPKQPIDFNPFAKRPKKKTTLTPDDASILGRIFKHD